LIADKLARGRCQCSVDRVEDAAAVAVAVAAIFDRRVVEGLIAAVLGVRGRHEAAAAHAEHMHLAVFDRIVPAMQRKRSANHILAPTTAAC